MTALAVYAFSVSGLFGISALYHRGTWSPPWSVRLQRMDHLMIFFLIAGTATPAFLLAMPGPFGLTCLIAMWTLILAAAGHPPVLDERARGPGRRDVHRAGLAGRPRAAGGMDQGRRCTGNADARAVA